MPTTSPTPAVVVAHATASFTVLGVPSDHVGPAAASHPHSSRQKTSRTGSTLTTPPQPTRGIFLDVNEPYTRGVIAQALQARSSLFHVVHGPGVGEEPVPLPSECDFQWSEYERIDWDAVLAGRHGAASYCVRKGLSRKAQMAYYTRLHVAKHPTSLLRRAIPTTVVLDTWPVWEEGGHATARGLADILVTAAAPTSGSTNRRERLEQCLVEAAQAMREATEAFEARQDESAAYPVWILKGSTVNKGMGIYIVHLYEQVVDICWSETDIREW
jgi:tubulin--tyrosine ligase